MREASALRWSARRVPGRFAPYLDGIEGVLSYSEVAEVVLGDIGHNYRSCPELLSL